MASEGRRAHRKERKSFCLALRQRFLIRALAGPPNRIERILKTHDPLSGAYQKTYYIYIYSIVTETFAQLSVDVARMFCPSVLCFFPLAIFFFLLLLLYVFFSPFLLHSILWFRMRVVHPAVAHIFARTRDERSMPSWEQKWKHKISIGVPFYILCVSGYAARGALSRRSLRTNSLSRQCFFFRCINTFDDCFLPPKTRSVRGISLSVFVFICISLTVSIGERDIYVCLAEW